jgi:hypothetical protein
MNYLNKVRKLPVLVPLPVANKNQHLSNFVHFIQRPLNIKNPKRLLADPAPVLDPSMYKNIIYNIGVTCDK